MQEFVPEDIRALIVSIEASQAEEFQARKRAEEAEAARLRGIEELRKNRRQELYEACVRIKEWIRNFEETVGPSIWRLGGGAGVVIFSAKFFRGEPTPPGDVTCSAQLRLGNPHKKSGERLVYEEMHKGHISSKQVLLWALSLEQRAHPDFVMQCDAHLSGPDAWKHVRQTLERLRQVTLVRR